MTGGAATPTSSLVGEDQHHESILDMCVRSMRDIAAGAPLDIVDSGHVRSSFELSKVQEMARRDWLVFGAVFGPPGSR